MVRINTESDGSESSTDTTLDEQEQNDTTPGSSSTPRAASGEPRSRRLRQDATSDPMRKQTESADGPTDNQGPRATGPMSGGGGNQRENTGRPSTETRPVDTGTGNETGLQIGGPNGQRVSTNQGATESASPDTRPTDTGAGDETGLQIGGPNGQRVSTDQRASGANSRGTPGGPSGGRPRAAGPGEQTRDLSGQTTTGGSRGPTGGRGGASGGLPTAPTDGRGGAGTTGSTGAGPSGGRDLTQEQRQQAIGGYILNNWDLVDTGAGDTTGRWDRDDITVRRNDEGKWVVGPSEEAVRQARFSGANSRVRSLLGVGNADYEHAVETARRDAVNRQTPQLGTTETPGLATTRVTGAAGGTPVAADRATAENLQGAARRYAATSQNEREMAETGDNFGDVNWTSLLAPAVEAGTGVDLAESRGEDPVERRIDETLGETARGVDEAGDNIGAWLRSGASPAGVSLASPGSNPGADVIEGAFSLAAEGVRVPSYALEGVESAAYLGGASADRFRSMASGETTTADVVEDNLQASDAAFETVGVDVLDVPQESRAEQDEFERRLYTAGEFAQAGGEAQFNRAAESPEEIGGELLAGFGAGAALGGASRAARAARLGSRGGGGSGGLRGRVSSRIAREREFVKSALGDERAMVGGGGQRLVGDDTMITGDDLDVDLGPVGQQSTRTWEEGPTDTWNSRVREGMTRAERQSLRESTGGGSAPPRAAAALRRAETAEAPYRGMNDVAEGAGDVKGFGSSPFDVGKPSVTAGGSLFDTVGGVAGALAGFTGSRARETQLEQDMFGKSADASMLAPELEGGGLASPFDTGAAFDTGPAFGSGPRTDLGARSDIATDLRAGVQSDLTTDFYMDFYTDLTTDGRGEGGGGPMFDGVPPRRGRRIPDFGGKKRGDDLVPFGGRTASATRLDRDLLNPFTGR